MNTFTACSRDGLVSHRAAALDPWFYIYCRAHHHEPLGYEPRSRLILINVNVSMATALAGEQFSTQAAKNDYLGELVFPVTAFMGRNETGSGGYADGPARQHHARTRSAAGEELWYSLRVPRRSGEGLCWRTLVSLFGQQTTLPEHQSLHISHVPDCRATGGLPGRAQQHANTRRASAGGHADAMIDAT
jgi:hypothetical protein